MPRLPALLRPVAPAVPPSVLAASRGGLLVWPLVLLASCAEARLPDLTVPIGPNARFGTDLAAEDPVLGITVTDPFDRLPG